MNSNYTIWFFRYTELRIHYVMSLNLLQLISRYKIRYGKVINTTHAIASNTIILRGGEDIKSIQRKPVIEIDIRGL